jgi:hypothetical protein
MFDEVIEAHRWPELHLGRGILSRSRSRQFDRLARHTSWPSGTTKGLILCEMKIPKRVGSMGTQEVRIGCKGPNT